VEGEESGLKRQRKTNENGRRWEIEERKEMQILVE